MKHLFTLCVCSLLLFACRKTENHVSDYLANVKLSLQDSLTTEDFTALHFNAAVLSKVDSAGLYFLRIPFNGKNIGNDFVLVQTNKEGQIQQGRIVHLEGSVSKEVSGKRRFDGRILLHSLTRQKLVESPIENGFITAFHQQVSSRSSLVQPGNVMPEVVITYVIPSGSDGFSWSTWMSLQSLFNTSGVSPYYSYFTSSSDPWNYGGGGGGGGGYPFGGGSGTLPGGTGMPANEPPILIDFENQDESAESDVQKIINCFNAVPNSGAHCSIEILTDIPVDANSNTLLDLGEKAPGHVFLKLSKHNGTQHVEQYLGFYPKSGYKSITYAPVASKLASNAFHEYNASMSMNLTPEQLTTALSALVLYSGRNYDIDQYNCTDFALDVFNSVRGIGLSIPLYGLPGSPMTQATRTPNGLYHKLKEMYDGNDPEKPQIAMGLFKGWAGANDGQCN